MAEISVIIPVYNKEKYIAASLRSVLDQSFRDIEVIIVNDGSTDGSLEIIHRFSEADTRIRVFDVPNGGVSSARNIGLEHATGNWIQFLDADDILESDYLQSAIQILNAENADILFSGFTIVDPRQIPVREVCIPVSGMRNQQELCSCYIRYQTETGFFGYISNKLFSHRLLDISGARFPIGTKLAEDLHFYARLYPYVEHAYFWNGRSFLYLQTEDNYLNDTAIDYRSQLMIHLDIKRWFEKSGLYETYRSNLDHKISQYAGFVLFHDNEDGKELRDAYSFLLGNPEIMASINPQLVSGFTKVILTYLQNQNFRALQFSFASRNFLRSIYRKLK